MPERISHPTPLLMSYTSTLHSVGMSLSEPSRSPSPTYCRVCVDSHSPVLWENYLMYENLLYKHNL